jgi:hypothetical protein
MRECVSTEGQYWTLAIVSNGTYRGTKRYFHGRRASWNAATGTAPAGPSRLHRGAVPGLDRSWEQFRDDTLMPRMQAGIDGGFAAPPQETTFEVHEQVSA